MQDSVNEDHPDELDPQTDDLITATFAFTFRTFLFGGTTKARHHIVEHISSYTTTVESAIVHEFIDDDEVRAFLDDPSHAKLSSVSYEQVETEVSSIISSDEYDDGIPKIN